MKTQIGIVAFIILSLTVSTVCFAEKAEGVLFPGQSITMLNIRIEWVFLAEGELGSDNIHYLKVYGPQKQFSCPIAEFFRVVSSRGGSPYFVFLYIDEVVLKIKFTFSSEKPIKAGFVATSQASVSKIDNKYQNLEMFVSTLCPISIDEWKISLSEDKIALADGSQYYMIRAENEETKENIDIPVARGSLQKRGRFTLEMKDINDELTKTQRIYIAAEPDMTIRGRDAYIDEFVFSTDPTIPHTVTIQYFLETFAEKYGFEIRWDQYPGHPESVDSLKSLSSGISGSIRINKRNVGDFIDPSLNNKGIAFEWINPTTLRLWYKDYEKVLWKKEQEKEEEELLQAKKDEFQRDYAIETKAYQFNAISVETAKSLITPELDTYCLVRRNIRLQKADFLILKGDLSGQREIILEKIQETAVADEKTNTLILSAIPKTHEKFQEMIKKIDAILKKSESPISVKPFKISLSLFQGTKSANLDENARARKKQELLKQEEQYGINNEDIELLDFDTLEPIGKGFTLLYPEKGEIGKTMVSLGKGISCTLEYIDMRQPYLIVRASLNLRDENTDAALFESTLYLVPEKPATLGVTDLKGAYIMVVKLEKPE